MKYWNCHARYATQLSRKTRPKGCGEAPIHRGDDIRGSRRDRPKHVESTRGLQRPIIHADDPASGAPAAALPQPPLVHAMQPTWRRSHANDTHAVQSLARRKSGRTRRPEIELRGTVERHDGHIVSALDEPFGNGLQQALRSADHGSVTRRDVQNSERARCVTTGGHDAGLAQSRRTPAGTGQETDGFAGRVTAG